jgi:hypothetical protein
MTSSEAGICHQAQPLVGTNTMAVNTVFRRISASLVGRA